jgi:Bacterial lectin
MLNGDTVNGGPIINSNTFVVSDGTPGENRSAWFRDPLYVGAFQASFTYQDVGGGGADGIAFVIQNDPRGTNALGYTGGGLGYCDITPSIAVLLNIYNGAQGGSGFMLGTNGIGAEDLTGANSGNAYQSTAPVNLDSGDPINVFLHYDGTILQVTLTDAVSSSTFVTNLPINIPSFVNSNTAWVGITGSEGDANAFQTVSNFTFAPLPPLTLSKSGSNMILSWPASIPGFTLQAKSCLTNSTWSNVTTQINFANGLKQTTIYSPTSAQFYRLVTARQPLIGGLTAKGPITITANGFVDSFDSSNPLYSSNGLYTPALRKDRASVLTLSGATNAITLRSNIYGNAITGTTGVVTGGTIGDLPWISAGNIGFEPGHVDNDANIQINDISEPFPYGTGITPVFGNYTYGGTNYNIVLGSGDYNLANLGIYYPTLVTGTPSVLYVNGPFSISGGYIYVAPGASLQIYLNGTGEFEGGGMVNSTGPANNVIVYGMTNCTRISFSAASMFVGIVNAPEAALAVSGVSQVSGAVVANTIIMTGDTSFHFDESLLDSYR